MARALIIFTTLAVLIGGTFAWAIRSQPSTAQASTSPPLPASNRINTKYDEFRNEWTATLDLTPTASATDTHIALIHTTRGKVITGESVDYPMLSVFNPKERASAAPELLIDGKPVEIKGGAFPVISYQQLRDISAAKSVKLRVYGRDVIELSSQHKVDIVQYLKLIGR